MTTTRELCRALGAILQVRDVEKWAAKLVRDKLLPRAGHVVNEQDAPVLLLAVATAPLPHQATEALGNLMNLRLECVDRSFTGAVMVLGTDEDRAVMPSTVIEAVTETLEYEASGSVSNFRIVRLGLEHGGQSVTLDALVQMPDGNRGYRAYYSNDVLPLPGLRTFAEVPGVVFCAVAEALQPQPEQRRGQEPMSSVLMH